MHATLALLFCLNAPPADITEQKRLEAIEHLDAMIVCGPIETRLTIHGYRAQLRLDQAAYEMEVRGPDAAIPWILAAMRRLDGIEANEASWTDEIRFDYWRHTAYAVEILGEEELALSLYERGAR
ncbi:MAG: hypothetical protein GY898_06795 [Proteobacteria bacterium]|nr:hypothetical protein [Pseudomonadota bacterium]